MFTRLGGHVATLPSECTTLVPWPGRLPESPLVKSVHSNVHLSVVHADDAFLDIYEISPGISPVFAVVAYRAHVRYWLIPDTRLSVAVVQLHTTLRLAKCVRIRIAAKQRQCCELIFI